MLKLIAAAFAAVALAGLVSAPLAAAAEPGDSAGAAVQSKKEVTREDLLKSRTLVQSEVQRRTFRTAYWAAGLTGDKKAVFDTYGYPSVRSREEKLGELTETWFYLDGDRSFTFLGDRLIDD
jgi:hypothetical protein